MAECLFRRGKQCDCSLSFTLEMLKGAKIDRDAARRIMGRACPSRPTDTGEEKEKKS